MCLNKYKKTLHQARLFWLGSAVAFIPDPELFQIEIDAVIYTDPLRWNMDQKTEIRSYIKCRIRLCGLFYEAICCMSFHMCHFVLVFFSPFSIAIILLGEERANLSAFRTFVRFVLVWICFLFLLGSGKGCGLWLWHSLDLLPFF